jgi:hypothetical protein
MRQKTFGLGVRSNFVPDSHLRTQLKLDTQYVGRNVTLMGASFASV